MNFSLSEIAAITGAEPQSTAPPADRAAGYSIDSRTLRSGEVFFAIRGERFDGHDFVEAALRSDALAAVVAASQAQRYSASRRPRLLLVPDPLAALQHLARESRRRWAALGGGRRLAAVTGSAGKTTTKEMIAAVLSTRLRTLKSEGNLNNHFGLPLTLLRLDDAHEAAVVEMGMNHGGEITQLALLAEPEIGVFTNVGEAHLGNFNSIAEVAEAKRELARALPPGGAMILNADDVRVAAFGDGYAGRCRYYGVSGGAGGVRIESSRTRGGDGSEFIAVANNANGELARVPVRLQFPGRGHIANAAAALTTGLEFGIDLKAAAEALAPLGPGPGRGRALRINDVRLIDDCYNANPAAMEQMLDVLAETPAGRRIAVLGEMRELGAESAAMHRRIGRCAAATAARGGLDALFAVAGEARSLEAAARDAGFRGDGGFCSDALEAGRRVREYLQSGDVALFKASRGVGLERALQAVMEGGS